MQTISHSIFYIFILGLVACASQPYIEPEPGMAASVKMPKYFEKKPQSILNVFFGGELYDISIWIADVDDNGCKPKKVVWKYIKPELIDEENRILVPAGRPILVKGYGSSGDGWCHVDFSTTLEVGEAYSLKYYLERRYNFLSSDLCRLEISDNNFEKVPIKEIKSLECSQDKM